MEEDLESSLRALCSSARQAARVLSCADSATKNELCLHCARHLEASAEKLKQVNRIDLDQARKGNLAPAMVDRLELTDARIDSMIRGIHNVTTLKDPVGETLRSWRLPNGIEMEKVRVPIGVIGIIYESRPNVTVDAGVLCLKTGNVPLLRGGKEAFETNRFLVGLLREAASAVGLPQATISFVPTTDRQAIPVLCRQDDFIDLMIPRGGHGLIRTVVEHARMPVIKHYTGVCHLYLDEQADREMARELVLNAKIQRPGVCNSIETLLVHRSLCTRWLPALAQTLEEAGVSLLGESDLALTLKRQIPEPVGWDIEYLDNILAIRLVDSLEAAVDHIETYGSHHTDGIVTENRQAAEAFLRRVDSATVFWNASTRFADGGEFGFGAEIGISTDKIHARGPMGLEELTSYKYIGRGTGQVRG